MRLFVAVELAEHVRRAAEDVARALQRELADTLRARWIDAANMHLTVRFIGHLADDRAAAVLEALRPPVAITPFTVALGQPGVFPPQGPPRVLWIGLEEGFPSLKAMHEECNRRLQPLGLEPENRPYRAHLTVARVKDAPRSSAVAVRNAIHCVAVPDVRCPIDHATVFESRLSSRGSTYLPLLRTPLL